MIPQRKSLARGGATLAVAAFLAAGCSSSKSTPAATPPASTPSTAASTPSDSASTPTSSGSSGDSTATAAITDLYNKFFDNTVDASSKVDLVQNGAKMNGLITALGKGAQSAKSSVKVESVSLTSPTHATVPFDILLNGAVALPNVQGQALLDAASGKWQVADVTLCSLAKLTPGVTPDVISGAGCQ